MIRSYFLTDTINVSTNIDITIPNNVKLNRIIISQSATADFDLLLSKEGTNMNYGNQGNANLVTDSTVYHFIVNTFSNIKIDNASASNTLSYFIYGEELLL